MGQWKTGFVARYGICSSVHAEIQALAHGLQLAWDMGCRVVVVELDSEVVFGLVSKGKPINKNLHWLVSYYKGLLNREWQVILQHCYREANNVADRLANMGMDSIEGMHLLQDPTNEVLQLVRQDFQGVAWPRLMRAS
ncbi:hypothetical protein P3X46_033305 [Hevea brasiliensis]|uniref:RNase H type-1 domain-containing protein n=1 Tax=Hevea brasiliensis TaxID=3981 RepID=A0ABQ9KJ75_HEVBR|nr:hypothetical protein P3X46_033305 [Hevea brasiliensis]